MDTDWRHSGIRELTAIDTEDSWLKDTLLNSFMSTEHFAKTFLPETFSRAMTYQHKEVWSLFDDDTLPKVAACCWRGFGKSSMAEAKMIKNVVFRQSSHIMTVGATEDAAAEASENIKTELLGNAAIREVFGWFKPDSRAEIPLGFSKKTYFLIDPKEKNKSICVVHPKGSGQRVRGARAKINGKTQRPDFIFIDDLEDDEAVLNEELRRKLSVWFNNSLLNCVDGNRPNPKTNLWDRKFNDHNWKPAWRIIYTDTLKHEAANMADIMADSEWHHRNFPQAEFRIDSDGHKRMYSLVPEIVSHEQVRFSYKAAKDRNQLDAYCQEMLCSPMSTESACWTREMFKYYDENTVNDSRSMLGLNQGDDVERFIVIDPAKTSNPKSCPTGMIAVGIDYKSRKIHIRKEVNERLSTMEMLERAISMALEYNSTTIAVEITGLEDVAKHLFVTEALSRNLKQINFVWLDARQLPKGDFGSGSDKAKRARASMILPYYQKGLVYHDVSLRKGILESQCLSYPKSAKWDVLDCAGHIPKLLSIGGRYFESEISDNPFEKTESFEADYDWDELGREIESGAWRYI